MNSLLKNSLAIGLLGIYLIIANLSVAGENSPIPVDLTDLIRQSKQQASEKNKVEILEHTIQEAKKAPQKQNFWQKHPKTIRIGVIVIVSAVVIGGCVAYKKFNIHRPWPNDNYDIGDEFKDEVASRTDQNPVLNQQALDRQRILKEINSLPEAYPINAANPIRIEEPIISDLED